VITAGEFRKGSKFLHKNEPHVVVSFQHNKVANRRAIVRTKIRNMITGSIYEENFRAEDKFEVPDLQYRQMQYLYIDGEDYHFMDQENYDQVVLHKWQLEEVLSYLKPSIVYSILYFDGKPIDVSAPNFMELTITESQPGVRGDTAQGGATKPATLETGLVIQVPLFVNEGDAIKVDTRDGSYIERVKK
jgi:elongation factor P